MEKKEFVVVSLQVDETSETFVRTPAQAEFAKTPFLPAHISFDPNPSSYIKTSSGMSQYDSSASIDNKSGGGERVEPKGPAGSSSSTN